MDTGQAIALRGTGEQAQDLGLATRGALACIGVRGELGQEGVEAPHARGHRGGLSRAQQATDKGLSLHAGDADMGQGPRSIDHRAELVLRGAELLLETLGVKHVAMRDLHGLATLAHGDGQGVIADNTLTDEFACGSR